MSIRVSCGDIVLASCLRVTQRFKPIIGCEIGTAMQGGGGDNLIRPTKTRVRRSCYPFARVSSHRCLHSYFCIGRALVWDALSLRQTSCYYELTI